MASMRAKGSGTADGLAAGPAMEKGGGVAHREAKGGGDWGLGMEARAAEGQSGSEGRHCSRVAQQ